MNLKKIIKEEVDDMWQNLLQGEPNMWFSYQTIIFDETPTEEEIIKLIKDAFKSGLVKQKSINSWEDEGLENEARTIITYYYPYLRIDLKDEWLYYGQNGNAVVERYPELRTIKYSEIKDYLINESEEEDDFAWITDEPLNPWLEYNAIIFNRKPKKKEINNYIELALSTRNPANKEAWGIGRAEDIKGILNYIKRYDKAVLMLDGNNNLVYSDPSGYKNKKINSIKYSQLVNKKINESEEYGLEWIKGIKPISVGTVFKPVYERSPEQAFYYVIESIDGDIITFRYPTTPNGNYDGRRTSRGIITTHELLDKIREGKISIIDNITESEEVGDFDWINDFEQPEIKFKKGDRVRIHNMGDKDAFINWLGMYANKYLNGVYGKNIEGTVLEGEDSMNEFSIVNITGGHKDDVIYFPYQEKMKNLQSKPIYKGLNLLYEPI